MEPYPNYQNEAIQAETVRFAVAKHLTNRRPLGFAGRAAVLTLAVLGAWIVVAPLANWFADWPGLWASALAAGCCWLPGLLALFVARRLAGQPLIAMLVAMGLRMALPLMVGLAVALRGGTLVEAGFLRYLVLFYLLTLAVETVLVLLPSHPPDSSFPGPARPRSKSP
jgi:hypothetical protein